ncbi:MAG: UDP-N-acetylglucosamine 1-carboxyvinyltransferase, partial [Ruminococcus sp.]|nr:UDP-N-acetylglucosamine 1-carboxyvinyltransferase [Ruminococcus sp.]
MQDFIITGGNRLSGEITLQGSKNSTLPIMAAAFLVNGKCTLLHCPKLTDVYSASRILNCLGSVCRLKNDRAEIDSTAVSDSVIPENLMREMRSSIMFMGAILGRMGECTVS